MIEVVEEEVERGIVGERDRGVEVLDQAPTIPLSTSSPTTSIIRSFSENVKGRKVPRSAITGKVTSLIAIIAFLVTFPSTVPRLA